jgi:hypothetical protein
VRCWLVRACGSCPARPDVDGLACPRGYLGAWLAGVYAITSLTATRVSPGGLAAIIRGHWMIVDRLHWIGDMDFDEDRSQVRTASGPGVMATLRNLALTLLRLAGHASIAAVLRHHARRPSRPLRTIMKC